MKLTLYKTALLLLIFAAFTASCNDNSTTDTTAENQTDSTNNAVTIASAAAPSATELFSIQGDFDGDGKKETLTEVYISTIDNKVLSKNNDDNLDYEAYRSSVEQQKPKTSLTSSNNAISDFVVTNDPSQSGLLYLKNEGDLNNDGTDELSYVINWTDHSTMNKVHIVSYKNGQWEELYSFSIRESIFSEQKFHLIQKVQGDNSKIIIAFVNEQAMEEFLVVDLNGAEKSPANNTPIEERFIASEDSIFIPEFTLDFELDADTKKLFANNKETLVLSIMIEGLPRKGLDVSQKDYYSEEQEAIYLLTKEVNVDLDSKTWTMEGMVSQEAFLALTNPDFTITINFFSGRKSSDANLIDVSYQGHSALIEDISVLKGKTYSLKVSLL